MVRLIPIQPIRKRRLAFSHVLTPREERRHVFSFDKRRVPAKLVQAQRDRNHALAVSFACDDLLLGLRHLAHF